MDSNRIKINGLFLIALSLPFIFAACAEPAPGVLLDQLVRGSLSLTTRIAEHPYEYTIGVIEARITLKGTTTEGETVLIETKTDEYGYFEVFLDEGEYTIVPEKLHWQFTPPQQTIKVEKRELPGINFEGKAAEGYEVDPWGYIFGPAMTAATWKDAGEACEALGGRLPTATEIYRNSYGKGLGTIGESSDTAYLWTIVDYYGNGNSKVVCRLSNGATYVYANNTTTQSYRCIWPDKKRDTFRGTYIYGPPGNEGVLVKMHGNRFYMDKWNRPALPYNAVLFEAAFYHAQLPSEAMYTALIRDGMENDLRKDTSDPWLWTADNDGYSSPNFLAGIVYWNGIDPNFDDSHSKYSTWEHIINDESHKQRSRFIGASRYPRDEILEIPTDKWIDRNSRLKADLSDRTKAVLPEAISACFESGGHLPGFQEMIFLIRSGLPDGTSSWIHAADMMYSGHHGIIRWSGTVPNFYFNYSGTMTNLGDTTSTPFRAVYYPIDSQYNGPDESFPGVEELFKVKIPRKDGKVVKIWADANDRQASSFAEAVSNCYRMGGHLATYRDMTELIRHGLPYGSNTWIWTSDRARYDFTTVIKWDKVDRDYGIVLNTDIAYINTAVANKYGYRCVWTNEIYAP